MAGSETTLEMVRRHVRQGECHVERQHAIIAALSAGGHPVDMATMLLGEFEATLREHRAHLARLTPPAD